MIGKDRSLAGRGVAMMVAAALAVASMGALSVPAMADDLGSMRQQLTDLTGQFSELTPIQRGSEDGLAAAGLIDDLELAFAAHEAESDKSAHLHDQLAAASAQKAEYAEGSVTRTVTSTGSLFKTFTATYTLSAENPGGDTWRGKVGFGSGFTQVFTSTLLDTAGLTSTVGVYLTWQNTKTSAARTALEVAYGAGYNSSAAQAAGALAEAQAAAAANEITLGVLEESIASGLVQLAQAIDNARILRFTNTVVSDQVGDGATIHLSVKGDTAQVCLAFRDGFPAEEGTGADFSDYTWNVNLTGDDVVAFEVLGDCLTLTSKPVLGTASFFVTATFNTTGDYSVADIMALAFSVEVIETLSFESSATEASADSTKAGVTLPVPPVKNAIGAVDYQLVSITPAEAYGRITFSAGAIRVAKEANAGTYDVVISAQDSKGYTDQTTVTLTVTNAYDEMYANRLAQLKNIEDEIATLLSVAELFTSDSDKFLTALKAFSTVSGPLEAMWANGKPVVNEQSIRGFTTALGAIGSIDPSIKIGTDLTIGTLNGLSKYLGYLPLDKQTAMEGYTINLVFMKFNFPSVPKLYVDAVLAAWNIFKDQITPVTGLINAYKDLYAFVTDTDYLSLRDLHAINAYIQTLYFKYSAFDTALNVFVNSKSFLVPVINALLGNVDNLVTMGLGLANTAGRPMLHGVIDPLIDTYLPVEQLNRPLKSLLDKGFDLVLETVGKAGGLVSTNLSLKDFAAFSGKVKLALGTLARASAMIVTAVDFNYSSVLEYDYSTFSSWDEYAECIYADFRATLGEAAGPNAAEFTAELDYHRDRILIDPLVAAALKGYQKASAAYDFLVGVVSYFSSGQAAEVVTTAKQELLGSLDELWASAVIGGQSAFATKVNQFMVQVRSAMPQDLPRLEQAMNEMARQLEELLAAAK